MFEYRTGKQQKILHLMKTIISYQYQNSGSNFKIMQQPQSSHDRSNVVHLNTLQRFYGHEDPVGGWT